MNENMKGVRTGIKNENGQDTIVPMLNEKIYNMLYKKADKVEDLEKKFLILKEKFLNFFNKGHKLYRCVSKDNVDYIKKLIEDGKVNINTLHPNKQEQDYSIFQWISQGSGKHFKGSQYSSTSLGMHFINREGSNICGKYRINNHYTDEMRKYNDMREKYRKYNSASAESRKTMTQPIRPTEEPKQHKLSNVECMLSIDIRKIIKEDERNKTESRIRIITPSTTYDETKKVHTTIGKKVINKKIKAEDIKEIQDEVHVDIYPACTPELLFTWFGCGFNRCTGFTYQNTAIAAITAQEVIMSGNYPIDILNVVACHPPNGNGVMKLLEIPMPIRDYCNLRETPEQLRFVEEIKVKPKNPEWSIDDEDRDYMQIQEEKKKKENKRKLEQPKKTSFLASLLTDSDKFRKPSSQ